MVSRESVTNRYNIAAESVQKETASSKERLSGQGYSP